MKITLVVVAFFPALWGTLSGVARLDGDAFVRAVSPTPNLLFGAIIVVTAGLSEAIAQSIVLFANRVAPSRFVYSCLMSALLFAFEYVFLVLSTWAVCLLPGAPHLALDELALVIALSYVPLVVCFLGALPYLGTNLQRALRVWHLLAMAVGVAAIAQIDLFAGASYAGVGWVVMEVARRSVGRPIATLGSRMLDAVAGVRILDDEQLALGNVEVSSAPPAGGASASQRAPRARAHRGTWFVVWGFAGLIALGMIVTVALEPLRRSLFGFQEHWPKVAQVPFDLLWLTVIAIVVSAFTAPLETLGWWAGWYGDSVTLPPGSGPRRRGSGNDDAKRFIIYLDGIAQSSSKYTPDIETFLDALTPELPAGVRLIRGVMAYSVMNRPLDDDPLFSRFWKFIEAVRFKNADTLLGMIINLRNVLIVAVSADPRYGPIYNYGIANVMTRALIKAGYRPGSGVPVTLIGYSGGGQMACGSASQLSRATGAPVDVISLGGVIAGNATDRLLDLEQLFHLTGTKDNIQRLGPIMFASRWPIAFLSNWNRARRLGRITRISLGPVGHQVPGGMLDPNATLPDGRSNLRQTLDDIGAILSGRIEPSRVVEGIDTNYDRYRAAPAIAPGPSDSDPHLRAVAPWMGRLILPDRDARFGGVWIEIAHAPVEHLTLAGTRVQLRWNEENQGVRAMLLATRRDVNFSGEATYSSAHGLVTPVRLDRWRLVDPLESLAGGHPVDDVVVRLDGPVSVAREGDVTVLRIESLPVQITGIWYGLVRFVAPAGDDRYTVTQYDREHGDFTGPSRIVRLPAVVPDRTGLPNSSTVGLERSPLNADGWYIYGEFDEASEFVVTSMAPRRALRPAAPAISLNSTDAYRFVRRSLWPRLVAQKGDVVTASTGDWKTGDRALLLHTYGGIGGQKREAAASGPVYFGHFAYGVAEVVDDPISGELRWSIVYRQVYTQNDDGLIAGSLDWSRYAGDRQFGWAGVRPIAEVALALPDFPLDAFLAELDIMTARYRVGDGTGCTYVTAAHNCSQDSNRALYTALRAIPDDGSPSAALARELRANIAPLGAPRDWVDGTRDLGASFADAPLVNIIVALRTWRCILPRSAFDTIARVLLARGAKAWITGIDQIGGERPEIDPVVPMTL